MREIKFRAWDGEKMWQVFELESDDGGCLTEVTVDDGEDALIKLGCTHESCSFKKFYSTVKLMQYTGLKDKNGVEIYEGDIIKDACGVKAIVEFTDKDVASCGCCFPSFSGVGFVARSGGYNQELDSKAEVIGNIYENPELLDN